MILQVLKASNALLKHIKKAEEESSKSKPDLLAGADEEDQDKESMPIWLSLTTKKHIVTEKLLKPAKITVPHSLNSSSNTTICLITADPQRTYKDIIASADFPATLRARITRVVGLQKLQKKWSQYEAQRKLFAEHDIFLADERIVTRLAKALGKTFYKTGAKRPIPISISVPVSKSEDKKTPKTKAERSLDGPTHAPGTPQAIAAEIERAIRSAVVHLAPSTNTAVKVGYSSWDAHKLAENVEAVANGLIEKFVPQKWRGVRALYVKGSQTTALPIWLADEMWVDEKDVLEPGAVVEANVGKKRKARALEGTRTEENGQKKVKKQKLLGSNDDNLEKEIALRREKLKKQKAEATKDLEDDVPKSTKKSKKGKAKTDVSE
jgi:ribosome biogenesis protein UTP30